MTMEAQIPRFDPALVALLWEIKGVQKTTKEIKSYSRKLLIFSKESKKCKFLDTRARGTWPQPQPRHDSHNHAGSVVIGETNVIELTKGRVRIAVNHTSRHESFENRKFTPPRVGQKI